jgi:peptide deformylase
MAIRPIVLYPDPVLLRPTKPVGVFDSELADLVRDLIETMHAAPGIGLAANQVGVSRRVCVVDLAAGEEPSGVHVFVNPRIVSFEGRDTAEEGCLSFPDINLDIERGWRVAIEAQDVEGRPFTATYEGLMARAVQHECEHLDGQVFLRNVSSLKRELVKRQIRKRIKAGEWVAPTPAAP